MNLRRRMRKGRLSKVGAATVAVLWGGLVGLGLGLGPGAAPAHAEGENELMASYMTVSPMNQQVILTPGETYTGSVKISNPASSETPLKYSVQVGSFNLRQDEDAAEEDDGVVDTTSVTTYNQMMEWITLDRTGGEVQPNETQTVTFSIKVPMDVAGGGQYASIIFQNDSPSQSGEGGVNIQSKVQIASLIYATVAGEAKEEGRVLSNEVPGFITASPLKTASTVQNDGNVHSESSYTLQVWPLFSNEELCTNEEKPAKAVVMPGSKQYHVETCDVGPVGIYRVKQTVRIFGEVSELERTLFVFPVWLMIVVMVAIVAVVVFLVVRVRKRKKARDV